MPRKKISRQFRNLQKNNRRLRSTTAFLLSMAILVAAIAWLGIITMLASQSPILFFSGILLAISLGMALGRSLSRPRVVPEVKLLDLSRVTTHRAMEPSVMLESTYGTIRFPSLVEDENEQRLHLPKKGRS